MDSTDVARICAIFGLGEPLGAPVAVAGGLLHRMWRLTTTRGAFAVKDLNPAIVRRPGMRARYQRTERVAAAMSAAGIPAVAALDSDKGPVRAVNGATVLVYPWIDGETLPLTPADPPRAHQIGAVLARMHALKLDASGLRAPPWDGGRADDWALLARQALARQVPWGAEVLAALPEIAAWTARYRQAVPLLRRTQVVSHRDLDQKNVLWRDAETPLIIDWESAGPINPAVELAGATLNWSGHAVGPPEEAAFVAVIAGYRDAGGVIQIAGSDALAGCLGSWLGWLKFCMRRSLAEAGASANADEWERDQREIAASLAALRSLALNVERWGAWIDGRNV